MLLANQDCLSVLHPTKLNLRPNPLYGGIAEIDIADAGIQVNPNHTQYYFRKQLVGGRKTIPI